MLHLLLSVCVCMFALQIHISLFFLSHLKCNWRKHKTKTNVETSKPNGIHSPTKYTHAPNNLKITSCRFIRSFARLFVLCVCVFFVLSLNKNIKLFVIFLLLLLTSLAHVIYIFLSKWTSKATVFVPCSTAALSI